MHFAIYRETRENEMNELMIILILIYSMDLFLRPRTKQNQKRKNPPRNLKKQNETR